MTADDSSKSTSNGVNGQTVSGSNGSVKQATGFTHPLGPLTGEEISRSSALIRAEWPEGTKFQFKVISLLEPPKIELAPYLEAERTGKTPSPIDRKSEVVYYLRNTVSSRRRCADD